MPVNQDSYESDLILWNNQDITIEGKSLFWRRWAKNRIYYIQDILNENGKFLTFENFNQRYNNYVSLEFTNPYIYSTKPQIQGGFYTKN